MKIKAFLMLTFTAASMAALSPAMADDFNNGSAHSLGSGLNPSSANAGSVDNNADSSNNMGSANNSDQASPDNPSGEDDY